MQASSGDTPNPDVLGLGEVVLWVNDLPGMRAFYRDVVGLALMEAEIEALAKTEPDAFERYAFFRARLDPEGGHGDFIALFDAKRAGRPVVDAEHSTFYHLALRYRLEGLEDQARRLEGLGLQVIRETFPIISCRSIFFHDPEGNQIELVADDPEVAKPV